MFLFNTLKVNMFLMFIRLDNLMIKEIIHTSNSNWHRHEVDVKINIVFKYFLE